MPHCIVCDRPVERWLAHPGAAQRSRFTAMLETVGSDLTHYQCPHCGCNDRERHLWLYMAAAGLPRALAGARLLHFAPERGLEALIARCGPAEYLRGDLLPTRPDLIRMDVQALPFEDGRFDLIISNHVLEHVADPDRALRELRRCLRDGGVLIAQTPYSPLLKRTFELKTPPDAGFAALFYGQSDHVRLFGDDIGSYFGAAGFEGRPLPHDEVLAAIDPLEFGCNPREPFFAFTRPTTLQAMAG
jgi:SAM-dependent methyltransferase